MLRRLCLIKPVIELQRKAHKIFPDAGVDDPQSFSLRYVIPEESHNNVLDSRYGQRRVYADLLSSLESNGIDQEVFRKNETLGRISYRNFIVDVPVRIDHDSELSVSNTWSCSLCHG